VPEASKQLEDQANMGQPGCCDVEGETYITAHAQTPCRRRPLVRVSVAWRGLAWPRPPTNVFFDVEVRSQLHLTCGPSSKRPTCQWQRLPDFTSEEPRPVVRSGHVQCRAPLRSGSPSGAPLPGALLRCRSRSRASGSFLSSTAMDETERDAGAPLCVIL
jgi:hypothetical protein